MIWPVDASVSQEYGSNPTANLPADSWLIQTFGNYQPNGHTGVDFPVHEGTPVRAVASGTVRHVGWYSGSYADNPYWISPSFAGFVLVIDHGGFIGIYAHLSGSPVKAGETVREGQTVAYSGNTGGSTGPHLHFEVLPDGWDFNNGMYGRVNPANYFGGAAIAPQGTTETKDWSDMASKEEFQQILWEMFEGKRLPSAIQKAVMNATAPTVDGTYWTLSSHLKGTAVRTVQLVKDVAALSGQVAAARNEIKQLASKTGVELDATQVEAAAAEGTRKALAEAQAVDAKLIADAVVDEQAARLAGDAA